MNTKDLDISSMYAYVPPSEILAERQKEDRTRKTCDVHLKRIAEYRRLYYEQINKPDPILAANGEVVIVSQSVFASRYRELLLRACLERGLLLSWDESIHYTDILVSSTEIPGPTSTPEEWVAAAQRLRKLMTLGVQIAVDNIARHQG